MKTVRYRNPVMWIIAIGFLAASAASALAAENVPLMTMDQLKDRLNDANVVVLDVRTGKDWSSSEFKIQGADRAAPDEFDTWSSGYSPDQTLVLYCA